MSKYETTGTITYIGDAQQVTEKFTKRLIALTVPDGQFSETPSFEFTQDKAGLLDGFREGQEVTIHWNLRGREYTPKNGGGRGFFTTLTGWKIEAGAGAAQPAAAPKNDFASANKNPALRAQPNTTKPDDDNDLPF